jgi:hypothetical protein
VSVAKRQEVAEITQANYTPKTTTAFLRNQR